MLMFMKIMYLKNKLLKIKFFAICLSLIVVGCGGSDDNGGGSSPPPAPALTCASDVQVCSAPSFTALYGGGVFYFNEATDTNQNEATDTNQPIKILEGEKQTFYAVIHDSDILSGESIEVDINSGTNNNLKDYFSSALKMAPEDVPPALENYTNAAGYEVFNFTLGERIALDDRVVGEYEIPVVPIDAQGLRGSSNIVVVIENVIDLPVIRSHSASGGISQDAQDSGTYRIKQDISGAGISIVVTDDDFAIPQNQESLHITITESTLPEGFITIQQPSINRPDSPTNNRATFRIEFASPTNELVGTHDVIFSIADLSGNTGLVPIKVVIENVNDAPVISTLTPSGGVRARNGNIFEVFEGGNEGTIRVIVDDADIQHGDIVGLNITGANLPAGVISIEKDKLSQSDARNNIVEFIVNIASNLLQDTDIGEYPLDLLVYDEFGGLEDRRTITLKVKNTDDASSVSYSAISGGVSKLGSLDGDPDTFAINEGQSGRIEVAIFDEDLTSNSQLEYAITGDAEIIKLLRAYRIKRSLPRGERKVTIGIAERHEQLNDADIGSYNLSLHVVDDEGIISVSYPFVLKVNNVGEQLKIKKISPRGGLIFDYFSGFYKLKEHATGSLGFLIEDEDFGSPQNQESINVTIISSTLPNDFITVQQSEINYLDSSTGNRVTFIIEFARPTNELVGEHNITFSFADTNGNIVLYKRGFKIENVNAAPAISTLTSSGGVTSSSENIFEVFEGGDNGIIRVIVDDADIQHGDIITLNITSANLPAGVISIENNKLSQSDTINNQEENSQVEFVIHIAAGLLQDTYIGEYPLDLLVYDELGKAEDRRTITLKVINSDDASTANYLGVSGMVKKLDIVDGTSDTFTISEGQSGQIKVAISDEDLIRTSQLEYTITGNSIREGLLNITKVESSSSAEEQTFIIDIGKNGSPIDDADIGSYNLNLRVTDAIGTVNANYPFVLKVNNIIEQPNIINVLAGEGVSAAVNDNSWTLSEDVAGSLEFLIEDEDFGSPQNQESLHIDIMSSTLSENFITIQQSEISSTDSSTNNRVTFRIQFAAPTDELVGEHNITFSFTDADGNTALYKGEFKIENINDAPEISAMDSARGVVSNGENIFEVFEGGEDGIIRVTVRDADIQHGDIVSLNIISADLPGIISIEEDKLSQSDARNNIVEFVLNVASGLLQDDDIGEHQFQLLVYDEFGGIDGSRYFTLNVKNTDDTSSINYSAISGRINKLGNVDGAPDTFEISEGQSGQIKVAISDEDLIHPSQLGYTITGDSIGQGIREGLLNITRVESLSSSEEHTFLIDIGKNGSPIDDADIGSYNLNLHIFDAGADRRADALYSFVLEINNLPEPTAIINVQAGQGAVAGTGTNYFVLTEEISASLEIIVMDEDLVNPLAQENITMEIISSDLPNDLLLAKSLYISHPDTVGGNQATFVLEIAAPRNEDVRDDNYTISFIISGTSGRSSPGEISIRIENVNDVPVMSPLTHSGGVGRIGLPVEKNTFIVYEGGVNGAITVTVEDIDIQHGDTVSLEISDNALLGDSAFIDKYFSVESSIAGTNQVEFTIHIASELMQDTDIGEHLFQLSVFDDFGGSATRDIVVIVEDTNDLTTISNPGWTGNLTKIAPISSPVPNNGRDLFTIYEGQSGQIEFTLSDEDLALTPLVVSKIAGDSIDSQIISSAIITKPSSPDERILTINIGNNSSGTQKINDVHIGTYELSLNISSSAEEVAISYPFTLQIINVEEQPRIIEILPGAGTSGGVAANSLILTQDVATSFMIVVEDEDFANPQNQENITIAASYPTDPNSPFLTLISYDSPQINLPDTTGGKRATFVVKIAAPPNDFVGENTLSITAIDSSARTADLDLDLTVLNVNDAPRIVNITSSGSVRRSSADNFVVAEGASPEGSIDVTVEDIDFLFGDNISLTVASATLNTKFLSVAKAHIDGSDADSYHQVIFNIDIPSESLNDAEVGTHILEISATDTEGVIATRQVNLVVENVNDAPKIVSITHGRGIRKNLKDTGSTGDEYTYNLHEGGSGYLYIKVVDEDLIHSHENITVRWINPLSYELLSFKRESFTSVDANDGTVTFILQLGQGADFDDIHIGHHFIYYSILDSTGTAVSADGSLARSRVAIRIVNVPEPPFFPRDNHNIVIFEQSGAIELPIGMTIATIGQAYCSGIDSTSGCESPRPVLAASDPDPGDVANLYYILSAVDTEYFYLDEDGLTIKIYRPVRIDSAPTFFIHVSDPKGMLPPTDAFVTVHIKSSNNLNQDSDGDGVRDSYDGAPGNPAMQTMGSGTRANPYLIHNIYQLQAIAGVDHRGNSLQASEFTGNSYLYGNGLAEQLSSHYRLANNIDASLTSTWNSGSGFMSIGVGACGGSPQQCDDSTAARRVSGSPTRFSGTFKGANFEISGLTIKRESSYLGLFGEAGDGSIISNLRLTSANIINPATRSRSSHALKFSHGGVLVGQMLGGTIDNVHVTGTLKGVGYRYGGLVGTLGIGSGNIGPTIIKIPGIIANSMADVDITANGVGFGGLVGSIGSNSFIHASNAKGNVMSALDDFNQVLAQDVGGLVGISHGNIFASYALGDVRGSEYVGGLVGKALKGTTTANFAAGDVRGNTHVGGLFGAASGGTHRYSYYSGLLVASGRIRGGMGGIVGTLGQAATIYSVINMRSPHPSNRRSDGGLIFGHIDLVGKPSPNIHDAYSIIFSEDSLGYITHQRYRNRIAPLSLLGDNSGSIRKVSLYHFKYCRGNGSTFTAFSSVVNCNGLFHDNYWGDLPTEALGADHNVVWNLVSSTYPTIKVQRFTVRGALDRTFNFPSHEEQICHIQPEYTHRIHCPTRLR